MRFKISLPSDATKAAVEEAVLKNEKAEKWLKDKDLVKVIVVPGKIVNIVVR